MTAPDRPTAEQLREWAEKVKWRCHRDHKHHVNCVGYYDDGEFFVYEALAVLLAEVERLEGENERLVGVMRADDERLRVASERIGIFAGCDAPDEMAEKILFLRAARTTEEEASARLLAEVQRLRTLNPTYKSAERIALLESQNSSLRSALAEAEARREHAEKMAEAEKGISAALLAGASELRGKLDATLSALAARDAELGEVRKRISEAGADLTQGQIGFARELLSRLSRPSPANAPKESIEDEDRRVRGWNNEGDPIGGGDNLQDDGAAPIAGDGEADR